MGCPTRENHSKVVPDPFEKFCSTMRFGMCTFPDGVSINSWFLCIARKRKAQICLNHCFMISSSIVNLQCALRHLGACEVFQLGTANWRSTHDRPTTLLPIAMSACTGSANCGKISWYETFNFPYTHKNKQNKTKKLYRAMHDQKTYWNQFRARSHELLCLKSNPCSDWFSGSILRCIASTPPALTDWSTH